MASRYITVTGARQNNLKGIDVRIPMNRITVVTGVSGSGKSSLAFDTIYAEGQRRYVETFSAYTRQFLDRMDKPAVDSIDGIPAAVAIDQTNPVRTSRSTVGTMTELNDHIKLLFPRLAELSCRSCNRPVRRDTPDSALAILRSRFAGAELRGIEITFPVRIPAGVTVEEAKALLAQRGYHRIVSETDRKLVVIQDRVAFDDEHAGRITEDLEAAFHMGDGELSVLPVTVAGPVPSAAAAEQPGEGASSGEIRFSTDLHCPDCDIHYRDAIPNLFSFNSPIGACERCRGFGRVIGIDLSLVIPDETKTLEGGAIKPWQTKSYSECRDDLVSFAKLRGVRCDVAWSRLTGEERRWVIDGEGEWDAGVWYGVRRFFDWLEGRSYRMHIRVLLSKYRSYDTCPECDGARLNPEALLWRIDGRNANDVALMSIGSALAWFEDLRPRAESDEATAMVLDEIVSRLRYLVDVGLSYLSLDRQSRTLSGGEVQRINLTTALGTALTNTLFVLDEPSIGLHSRDIGRLVRILEKLRDSGNTLLIVEHDPEVIRAADQLVDLGPGPGSAGGTVVFSGSVPGACRSPKSLTGAYLSGRKRIGRPERLEGASDPSPESFLAIRGAREHNLRGIDVAIPTDRFVCITGVSGSGKSTLIEEILYRAAARYFGQSTDAPGAHDSIEGLERFRGVMLVDQSSIGKTARSNPASYVGAFDEIRKLFALEHEAKRRGYTAGTFSFNSGNGRCPSCGGTGFEHIEMQFLSDVYLRCPACDGRRFRPEILEIRIVPPGDHADGSYPSIADVLEMTVDDAVAFFSWSKAVVRALEPLREVGLGYLRLGQPVPTLSGGESQRLKLAGHLASHRKGRSASERTLFLLDEPTTGLHFSDIEVLVSVLRRLVASGDSVVVIEHNLSVIESADWIIDLGPEGGEAGGALVFEGTVAAAKRAGRGHTAQALRAAADQSGATAERPPSVGADGAVGSVEWIEIAGAREHNLKNVDIAIPLGKLTVITGVSGSGKSTVAFDILFAEGQRRYLESLNAYARQFVQPAGRPDVDSVQGVPPTVAIEQRTSRGGWKSTVGTVTEIYYFLRLLFAKLGTQYCPECGLPVESRSVEEIASELLETCAGSEVEVCAPLVASRKGYYTDLADWARRRSIPKLRVDGIFVDTADWPRLDRYREHSIEAPVGKVQVEKGRGDRCRRLLEAAIEIGGGTVLVLAPDGTERLFSTSRTCRTCARSFRELDPRLFSFNSSHGWCESCRGTGASDIDPEKAEEGADVEASAGSGAPIVCPDCAGTRLNDEARSVLVAGRSIDAFTCVPVATLGPLLSTIEWTEREETISRDLLSEIGSRFEFLLRVGLGYLSLDRSAPSLSGGEAQRIRLAAQLGSNLRGACYVLDEPTIGLHSRDTAMLLATLTDLKRKGNTVVVVEHDEATIRSADYLVDLGPGAGRNGGEVTAAGTLSAILRSARSTTGRYLRTPPARRLPTAGERSSPGQIVVAGANLHNLRIRKVVFPLGNFICVTGVSGSGKSTLVRDILYATLAGSPWKHRREVEPVGCSGITGFERIDRVLEVDQTPIGKTPRSCPATYIGFWDDIRRLYAELPEAKMHGFSPSRFSFNTSGGRCEVCKGQGYERVEMSFLPEVHVVCDECGGRRFDTETLAVRFKGTNIDDVLRMEVDEASSFFAFHPKIHASLEMLRDVGLGYLTLGQQSPTLSGGEAQRIKLVTELAKSVSTRPGAERARTLYVLDEPTVGLHMADVEMLNRVLHRLVEAGNTVVAIEHNLDVIAEADWVIDLGPEGGDGGGTITAEGSPAAIAARPGASHTARYLAEHFARRR